MRISRAASLFLVLSVPLLLGGDKSERKTPFTMKAGAKAPAAEMPRDISGESWRVGYIGCSDPSLAPPDQQVDHRDSAFLLTGPSGTAIYVENKSAVSKLLDYQGNVDLPGVPSGKVTCYVYAEKPGSRLWYFATTPAQKPTTPKYYAVSYADTTQKPQPTLTPFTWAMQTSLEEAAKVSK
jgi:hypothetical protein